MTTSVSTTAVGVFPNREQADRAIAELRQAGFPDDKIQVALQRNPETGSGPSGPPTWETGAGICMMTGAIFGAAGGAPGMLAGALGGALLGAFIDLGIPETDARFFNDEVQQGSIVVAVPAGDRYAEASAILRRHGAREAPPQV